MSKIKYGLFEYSTKNLGDEIQSIAARRFLPAVDYYFNRDNIDNTKIPANEKVKLIMNGWYMHEWSDGELKWPPANKNIEPLLVSMFIQYNFEGCNVEDCFLAKKSRKFLKRNSPIGARDEGTARFLNENGIKAYFSGCLTLTLLPDKNISKQDYILAVDVSNKLFNHLKSITDRTVIRLNTERYSKLNNSQKTSLAQYWLSLYQSAHCVISPRLHAMLPCLPLGTPILAIRKQDKDDIRRRYLGLIDLTNNTTEEDFISGKYKYDINNPPQNPNAYKKLSKSLSKECKAFTGYDSEASFMGGKNINHFLFDKDFVQSVGIIADYSRKYEEEVEKRKIENIKLNQQIKEARNPSVKQSLRYLKWSIIRKISRK